MSATHLIERLAAQTMLYPFKVWGFGEGIALEALWDIDPHAPHLGCRVFVLDIYEQWLSRPLEERDHSANGELLLLIYEQTGDLRYLDRARDLARHMMALPKADHAAALHRPEHPDYHQYLYVDCMEVDAPFLCKLGAVTGDASCTAAGVNQILAYSALLQHENGLFYHQYNEGTRQVNGAFWGRGNGWALLGLLKTLSLITPQTPRYDEALARFQRLATALAALQLPSGGWPTVLNDSDTYEEGSLPAMFGVGLHVAVQKGLLPPDFQRAADRAWERTLALVDDGLLQNVSIATPPGDAAHYAQIATSTGYPWGQGPALWFAVVR